MDDADAAPVAGDGTVVDHEDYFEADVDVAGGDVVAVVAGVA